MRGRIALVGGALVALALGGCSLKDSGEDLAAGKQAFVSKCGACHTLARAGTTGVSGPNLDAAFARALQDGFDRETVEGMVHQQILIPNRNGSLDGVKMPADLVKGDLVGDVAAYVAYAVARPGDDEGALAEAGQQKKAAGGGETVAASGGTLEIDADPSGALAYVAGNATAEAGALVIKSKNASQIPHNIALEGAGVDEQGEVVQGGGVSEISVDLKPGEYKFYCSVPGHREGGMEGTLTVE